MTVSPTAKVPATGRIDKKLHVSQNKEHFRVFVAPQVGLRLILPLHPIEPPNEGRSGCSGMAVSPRQPLQSAAAAASVSVAFAVAATTCIAASDALSAAAISLLQRTSRPSRYNPRHVYDTTAPATCLPHTGDHTCGVNLPQDHTNTQKPAVLTCCNV